MATSKFQQKPLSSPLLAMDGIIVDTFKAKKSSNRSIPVSLRRDWTPYIKAQEPVSGHNNITASACRGRKTRASKKFAPGV